MAQLADQHPTAENLHGDRPEGGGQEDVGAARLRQVLLPGREVGLGGVVASPLWASLISPATARSLGCETVDHLGGELLLEIPSWPRCFQSAGVLTVRLLKRCASLFFGGVAFLRSPKREEKENDFEGVRF